MHADGVAVPDLARAVGTPFYVYSKSAFHDYYRQFASAFAGMNVHICYALKALPNIEVVRIFAQMGAGADVVSAGEMRRAILAGISGDKIAFPGVAKTRDEILFALSQNAMQFNVESESELRMISDTAQSQNMTAHVVLRVNPDVDAKTHAKITTGKRENKFGIDIADAAALYALGNSLGGIEMLGVGAHIGSQILDLQPFDDAYAILRQLVLDLRAAGHSVRHVDLGGGLGVPYQTGQTAPSIVEYAAIVKKLFGDLNIHMVLEPGRCLVANAAALIIRAHHIKPGHGKYFILTDGGMNDLIRPTLYNAHHEIFPVIAGSKSAPVLCDIVGPVCESSDYLALGRTMPLPRQGDLLAVSSAGAYGASMASEFNSRPLIPEILVDNGQYAVIRRRPEYDEMWRLEQPPRWAKP